MPISGLIRRLVKGVPLSAADHDYDVDTDSIIILHRSLMDDSDVVYIALLYAFLRPLT